MSISSSLFKTYPRKWFLELYHNNNFSIFSYFFQKFSEIFFLYIHDICNCISPIDLIFNTIVIWHTINSDTIVTHYKYCSIIWLSSAVEPATHCHAQPPTTTPTIYHIKICFLKAHYYFRDKGGGGSCLVTWGSHTLIILQWLDVDVFSRQAKPLLFWHGGILRAILAEIFSSMCLSPLLLFIPLRAGLQYIKKSSTHFWDVWMKSTEIYMCHEMQCDKDQKCQ